MLLVLAVQQGWVGPAGRVVLGAVIAVGLLLAAFQVRRRERAAGRGGGGALALAATAYALAYLDVVAVSTIYGWVPPGVGIVLAALVIGSGLVLARRWDSELLAVLLILGGAVLGPVVIGQASGVLSAFMVVLALASWPAQPPRPWRAATTARIVPTTVVLVSVAGAVAYGLDDTQMWVQVAVAAAFAAGMFVLALLDARYDTTAFPAATVVVAGLPAFIALYAMQGQGRIAGFAVAAVVWLALTGVLTRLAGRRGQSLQVATGILGTLGVLGAAMTVKVDDWQPVVFLGVAVLYVVAAGATQSALAGWLALAVSVPALMVWLPLSVLSLVRSEPPVGDLPVAVVSSLLVVALAGGGAWALRSFRDTLGEAPLLVDGALWVLGLGGALTLSVSTGQLAGAQLGAPVAGYLAGHAVGTVIWMAAAAWLLLRGLGGTRQATLGLRLGLALSALVVAKLFLYDLASLSGIWRVVAFIIVGLLLLWMGSSYAKALDRARQRIAVTGTIAAAALHEAAVPHDAAAHDVAVPRVSSGSPGGSPRLP